jgi:predicted esterase
MSRKNSLHGPAGFVIAISLGIFLGLMIYVLVRVYDSVRPLWVLKGKLRDEGSYLVYLPNGWEAGESYPLVFALSPSADAIGMVSTWAPVAERHAWIIAASKEFHNGQQFGPSLFQIETELRDVEGKYNIDKSRVIFTGFSGGGMGAHAFSKFYPEQVSALVINTGMMEISFMTPDYPQRKVAVFLASPTDFRYTEMRRDRDFLAGRGWKTKWIEFSGGHALAPAEVYEQAADWLEANLP